MRSISSNRAHTKPRAPRRKRQSGSVMVLFTMMLPTLLIPLAGLAIDASIARLTQIRLQAAVDGAVLGAGRELGTAAVPETLAAEFLAANFRTDNAAGTWNAHNLIYNVVYTPGITKRIDVAATAQVPLLFMRIFGKTDATVGASGSATRSDSRVVFIIDRSGSMTRDDGTGTSTTVITDAINYTTGLAKKFLEGTDELGLVVFDGSAVVGYPTGAWTPTISLASTGGPNKTFYDGTGTDLIHQLGVIKANGGTGMAEAISIAYIELQKAHMRDLNADGVDTRLNSIVLLTDGVPSAVSLYLNNPASSGANNMVKTGRGCTYQTITGANSAYMMKSWLAVGSSNGSPPYTGSPMGLSWLASTDTTHTATWWLSNSGTSPYSNQDSGPPPDNTPYTGCSDLPSGTIYNSFSTIPGTDLWGNDMTGTNRYTASNITNSVNGITQIKTGADLSLSQVSSAYHWGLAMWNAVDSAAKRARTDVNHANRTGDVTDLMGIQIFVIGYSGNGGCDDGLLRRVANDKTATGYDSTQPIGRFYSAADGAQLANAYNQLASDLLRLAR